MTEKPTYEELEKKIQELEKAESERKWAEDELQVSEEKFRVLFEKSIHGILIVDIETRRFPYANSAFCRMFGYSETEMLMIGVEDIHPKDSLDYILSEFSRQKKGGKAGATELPCIHKDGTVFNADIAATNIVINHRKCVMGFFIDITERKLVEEELAKHRDHLEEMVTHRTEELEEEISEHRRVEEILKESEEKYRTVLEANPDPVAVYDIEGKVIYFNPAFTRLFGWSLEECLNKKMDVFVPEDAWHETKKMIKKVLSGERFSSIKTWRYNKKGDIIPVSISGAIYKDQDGNPIGSIINLRDISDQKKMEAQLQQSQKMESVGRLAGGVAHDYNNALTAIMGFTDLAMMDADPEGPLYKDLNEVLKAGKRAKDITRQLLAFARKQTIDPKVLDLNQAVESVIKMLRRLIGEDIDLVWLPGKNLWSVKMDPSQIDQILANLCVNGRDAIKGVGKITIESDMVELDKAYCADHKGFIPGEFVLLAVSDNGCGMDKEILDNIFEPFFTTKDVDKGTGLGLATVYGIVKQNNGFINVYSEPGKGTSIKIYLSRHEGKAIELQKENTDEIPQGQGETILLVEDDTSILKFIQKILNGLGYKVLAANSPKRALKLAKEHNREIHLLVTDVIMPEMNGLEMANNLQSLYPNLKRIFMSGYTANAIAHHGVLDEGIDFIQKPCSQTDLAKTVRKVLDENNN
jgi:two-component system, cell cycle sensor histidine kinase and response regulator CckA